MTSETIFDDGLDELSANPQRTKF